MGRKCLDSKYVFLKRPVWRKCSKICFYYSKIKAEKENQHHEIVKILLHHQEKREGEGIDASPKHRWCLKHTASFKFKLFIVFGLKEKSKSEINLALWRKYFSTELPGNSHWHLYCILTIPDDDFRFWYKLTAIQTFTKPIWPQYLKNKNIAIISGKNMWN